MNLKCLCGIPELKMAQNAHLSASTHTNTKPIKVNWLIQDLSEDDCLWCLQGRLLKSIMGVDRDQAGRPWLYLKVHRGEIIRYSSSNLSWSTSSTHAVFYLKHQAVFLSLTELKHLAEGLERLRGEYFPPVHTKILKRPFKINRRQWVTGCRPFCWILLTCNFDMNELMGQLSN